MKSDPSGFLKAVLRNGVGRYVCPLQRLTLKFCKEFGNSRGIREFIEHDLLDFVRSNPGIMVYLSPKRHQRPRLYAEYLTGRKEEFPVANYSREEIIKWIDYMRCKSGYEIIKFRKLMWTDKPSIQGPWTPFTHQPSDWNVKSFPDNDDPSFKVVKSGLSATEMVLEMAQDQGLKNLFISPSINGGVIVSEEDDVESLNGVNKL